VLLILFQTLLGVNLVLAKVNEQAIFEVFAAPGS
jgi:hypothetical protein